MLASRAEEHPLTPSPSCSRFGIYVPAQTRPQTATRCGRNFLLEVPSLSELPVGGTSCWRYLLVSLCSAVTATLARLMVRLKKQKYRRSYGLRSPLHARARRNAEFFTSGISSFSTESMIVAVFSGQCPLLFHRSLRPVQVQVSSRGPDRPQNRQPPRHRKSTSHTSATRPSNPSFSKVQ